MNSIAPTLQREILSVSQLSQNVRLLLERSFLRVWVEGEVSNLSRPASGHLYFSLKDANAQIRCALFRNRTRLSQVRMENGIQVLVGARVSLYETRGDFQLIVEHLEHAGDGALRRAYDALRLGLQQEGLFEQQHKRAIPAFPTRIGIITSPTGAAIRDVLSVLARRFPALPVLIYPVPVQGEGAGQEIAQAITLAGERRECDVLLLVRGGGSMEDLWAFNDEAVARAIYACEIPLVCGVGHEIDVTIADFVADMRAPTPSAAAELISPDRAEWLGKITACQNRLAAGARQRLTRYGQSLASLEQRLSRQHPGRRLQDRTQRLDELDTRLLRAWRSRLERLQARSAELEARLRSQASQRRLPQLRDQRRRLLQRLESAARRGLERDTQRLAALSRALHAVSPLQTLGRGYAIVRDADGRVIRRVQQVQVGQPIETLLAKGRLHCRVESVDES